MEALADSGLEEEEGEAEEASAAGAEAEPEKAMMGGPDSRRGVDGSDGCRDRERAGCDCVKKAEEAAMDGCCLGEEAAEGEAAGEPSSDIRGGDVVRLPKDEPDSV
jgi:hypothetical protein